MVKGWINHCTRSVSPNTQGCYVCWPEKWSLQKCVNLGQKLQNRLKIYRKAYNWKVNLKRLWWGTDPIENSILVNFLDTFQLNVYQNSILKIEFSILLGSLPKHNHLFLRSVGIQTFMKSWIRAIASKTYVPEHFWNNISWELQTNITVKSLLTSAFRLLLSWWSCKASRSGALWCMHKPTITLSILMMAR